jgi:hypothetical protein
MYKILTYAYGGIEIYAALPHKPINRNFRLQQKQDKRTNKLRFFQVILPRACTAEVTAQKGTYYELTHKLDIRDP